jgi:hypothetical protein
MPLVFLFYQELTHDAPTGFYETPEDYPLDRLLDDWLKAWPYGKVVCMTPATFQQTVWYRSFLENGWGKMTHV